MEAHGYVTAIIAELDGLDDYTSAFEHEDIRRYFINKFLNGFVAKTVSQGQRSIIDDDVLKTSNELIAAFTKLAVKIISAGKDKVFKALRKVFNPQEGFYDDNDLISEEYPVIYLFLFIF